MLDAARRPAGLWPAAHARRRLCWITPDYFLPVDAPVVPQLLAHYDVDWIVITARGARSPRLPEGLLDESPCVPRVVELKYRQRDPRAVWQYIRCANDIRAGRYDLVYTSFHGLPYFLPILAGRIDADRIIYAVHNASTPKGASNERSMRLYHWYVYRILRRFHVFSEYQLKAIAALAPTAKHYCAPFPLVDYGRPSVIAPVSPIRFLFFGHIRRYKRLDILIKAFQRVRKTATAPIELYIAGYCEDWSAYQNLIGDDPAITARVELIPAADIPDVFESSHYAVLPYQDIAQSAVLKLAFQYGKPVIVSDIEGFKESVVEGATGRFFRSESVDHLESVLRDVIAGHRSHYAGMQEHVKQLTAREYSIDATVASYRAFIEDALESRHA